MKRHLNDQMLKAIVDEYENAELLEDRAEYSVADLSIREHLTIGDARKLQQFVHERMGSVDYKPF